MSFRRNKKRNGGKMPERIFGCRILKRDLVETLIKVVGEILQLCGRYPSFDGIGNLRILAAFQSTTALLHFYAKLFDNKVIATTTRQDGSLMIIGTDTPAQHYRESLEEACAKVNQVYRTLGDGEDVSASEKFVALGTANSFLNDLLRLLRLRAVKVTFKPSTPNNCFYPNNFGLDSEIRHLSNMVRLAPGNGRNKTEMVLDFIGAHYRHHHRVLSDLRLGVPVAPHELRQAMEFGDIMATAFFTVERISLEDIFKHKNHLRRLPTFRETPSLLH